MAAGCRHPGRAVVPALFRGGRPLHGRDVNIFVQIGLVVLVALACKNAILVVEYAKQLHGEGQTRFAATQEASRLRLRPILMTSLAFIFGVVPLMIASGAGAEMRRSLGIAVFSGMLGVTLFGVFLTPVFFFVITGLSESRLFASPVARWFCFLGAGRHCRAGRRFPAGETGGRPAPLGGDRGRGRGHRCRGIRFGNPSENKAPAMTRFFVDRPIFATVISLVFVLAGGVAVFTLPVAQYPEVTPPTVLVTAFYPARMP